MSFGEELKRAREALGTPLRDMATRTKISVANLEALEKGDFKRIPGGLFGRSFVRTYALEVGLDADAIVNRFAEELTEAERIDAERRRARQPAITLDDKQFLERQRRAFLFLRTGIVVAVLAAVLAVTWVVRTIWFAPPGAAVPPATETVASPPAAAAPEPVAPAATDAAPVPVTAAPAAPSTAAIILDATFSGDSLVTIGLDGTSQGARTYRAGETARFEAASEILIDTNNAGVLKLVINGRPAKPLGAAGAHVRTRLTKDNLAQFY
jgi:cytoskeletal protein RodZ